MNNNIKPTDSDEATEAAFDEWREENNWSYYDSQDRLIQLPSRRLHSFDSVYEKFLRDTGRDQSDFQKKMLDHLHKAIAS